MEMNFQLESKNNSHLARSSEYEGRSLPLIGQDEVLT